jgi:hypothetical protein
MKFKKSTTFVCILLLFSLLSQTAMAYNPDTPGDDPVEPSPYTYIATIDVYFDISSSGLTDDYCRVYIPDSSCTSHVYMYLQRWNSSAGQWDTVKSWDTTGSGTITLEKEWYVTSGYTYRLMVLIYVYDSNGLLDEIADAYSIHIPY